MQQLQSLRYPGTIDVTDAVMAKVRTMPLLTPYQLRRQRFQRVVTAVAACAVFAVALNVTILFTRSYNEAQISDVIASVYNYNADYEDSPAFLVSNGQQVFIVVGRKAQFEFLSLDDL